MKRKIRWAVGKREVRERRQTLSFVGLALFVEVEIRRRADGSIPCGGAEAARGLGTRWVWFWVLSFVIPFVTRLWRPLEVTEARVVVVEAGMIFRAIFSSERVSSGDEGRPSPTAPPPPAQSMF